MIITANYPSGNPHNFRRIGMRPDAASGSLPFLCVDFDGNHYQFSSASGNRDELKICTVRAGNPVSRPFDSLYLLII